jgi:hypothetical protein
MSSWVSRACVSISKGPRNCESRNSDKPALNDAEYDINHSPPIILFLSLLELVVCPISFYPYLNYIIDGFRSRHGKSHVKLQFSLSLDHP